jgi:hypothetical protein
VVRKPERKTLVDVVVIGEIVMLRIGFKYLRIGANDGDFVTSAMNSQAE